MPFTEVISIPIIINKNAHKQAIPSFRRVLDFALFCVSSPFLAIRFKKIQHNNIKKYIKMQ
jgi:hypothetical protein